MAIFNQNSTAKKDVPSFAETPAAPIRETPAAADFTPAQTTPPRPAPAVTGQPEAKESLIAADLTIEGKIEGSGHVRIAGKFKGDVNVQGNLRIENGAKLNGGVKAKQVVVAGELEGNIDSAARVELLDSAVLVGDVKTGTLIVNAGSKIRGHVECGWDGKDSGKTASND
jgi:cytoskeletal protein CcmA (bactofilin family)